MGIRRLSAASSIGVYAGADLPGPYREEAALPLAGLHGISASKKIAEIIADLAGRSSGIPIVSLRLPAVWGPLGQPAARFHALPRLVHAAVNGRAERAAAADSIDCSTSRTARPSSRRFSWRTR